MSRRTVYFPHNTLLFVILSTILLMIVGLFLVGAISSAFLEVGFSPTVTIIILFATFLGGSVNIPLLRLEATMPVVRDEFVTFFGMPYRIPSLEYKDATTLVAVNVGGALIPAFVASYLLYKLPSDALWSLVGTILVALVTYMLAKPVSGVGIVTPTIVPPLDAALVGLLLPSGAPRVVAYVSGVLGTLIGADLSNLAAIPGLGAPVVSIGGAGTFDGVFLTGIIAVLLA
jgi:uncharacterized membrane protein